MKVRPAISLLLGILIFRMATTTWILTTWYVVWKHIDPRLKSPRLTHFSPVTGKFPIPVMSFSESTITENFHFSMNSLLIPVPNTGSVA